MFLPNNRGTLASVTDYDAFGESQYGSPVMVACAIVDLSDTRQKTPIRTDSSASRSESDEDVVKGMVLFPVKVMPQIGMAFVVAGISLRILSVQPRFDAFGTQDHWECTLEALPTVGS